MAVENVSGVYVIAPTEKEPFREASQLHFKAPYKTLMDRVTLPGAASIGSTIILGKVPSSTIVSRLGEIATSGLGTNVTLDVGLADDADAGLASKGDILVDGADVASAGAVSIVGSVAIANRFKPLWELAGLTEDPRTTFTLVATTGAAAVSAGDKTVAWEIPHTSY